MADAGNPWERDWGPDTPADGGLQPWEQFDVEGRFRAPPASPSRPSPEMIDAVTEGFVDHPVGPRVDSPPQQMVPFTTEEGRNVGHNIAGHIQHAGNVATLGLWPFLQAAVADAISPQTYSQSLAEIYQNMDATRQNSPITVGATEIAAGLLGARALMQPFVPRASAAASPSLVSQVVGGATTGAGAASAFGFAEGYGRSGGELQPALDAAGQYAVLGGGIGATIPLAATAAPGIARAIRSVSPSTRTRATGAGATYTLEDIGRMASTHRAQVRGAFNDLEQSGITMPRTATDDTLQDLMGLSEQALGRHPITESVLDDMVLQASQSGNNVPIHVLERWRQDLNSHISAAYRQGNQPEIDLLTGIRDAFDDQILGLEVYAPLREAWRRTLQLDTLEMMAQRATNRASTSNGAVTFDQAFRDQIQSVSERQEGHGQLWSRFTPEQREALTTVMNAQGPLQSLQNIMTLILGTGMRRAISTGGATVAAAVAGQPWLYIPAAGDLAARGAQALTTRANLNRAVEAVSGGPVPLVTEPLLQRAAALRYYIPATGASAGYRTGGGF